MGDIGRVAQAGSALGVAGIETAANMAMAKMNNDNQRSIAREYNAEQRALAEYQNDYNLDMWNRQNEYNSPEAQMQRLEEAGLNPNLIYGSGSSVGNSTSSPAPAATPDLKMPEYQQYSFGDVFSRALSQYYQMKQVDQNLELSKSQKEFVDAQVEGQRIENIMKGASTPFAKQLAERNVDMLETQYRRARNEEVSSHYDAQTKQYRYQHVVPYEEREMLTRLALQDMQLKLGKKQMDYVTQQTARIMYEVENLLPQYYQLNEQKQKLLTEQIGIAIARNKIDSLDAKFWEEQGLGRGNTKLIMDFIRMITK